MSQLSCQVQISVCEFYFFPETGRDMGFDFGNNTTVVLWLTLNYFLPLITYTTFQELFAQTVQV